MNRFLKKLLLGMGLLGSLAAQAGELVVPLYSTEKNATLFGQVLFKDTPFGLLVIPQFTGLPPGQHGFHLHEHASCGMQGQEAGGHYDPQGTKKHKGPYDNGHLGDLPALFVSAEGQATTPTLAPRLKTTQLHGLTVMIHAGGDNYSDTPPMGGGGARIACGKIK